MRLEEREFIEKLYLEMYDKLKIYAKVSLYSEALAEEAVQEAFGIACQKPEALYQSPNPRGWLMQTLKYTICNMKSSRETGRRILEQYQEVQKRDNVYTEDRTKLHLLYGDVAQLEDFILLYEMIIVGKSHAELAKSRGITIDACKKRVQRAKENLRKKIKL